MRNTKPRGGLGSVYEMGGRSGLRHKKRLQAQGRTEQGTRDSNSVVQVLQSGFF